MLKFHNYCYALTSVLHIKLRNTEGQEMRQVINCYQESICFLAKEKQCQVNRTHQASGKAIKRNKGVPGGDVHIDFVIFPSRRDGTYLALIYQ